MPDIIYLQLSLPSDKVEGYNLRYAPSRLPGQRYELQLYPNFFYLKDQFGRGVFPGGIAHGYGETISEAVDMALLALDKMFALTLAYQNERPPRPISGISAKQEIDELSNLLGL